MITFLIFYFLFFGFPVQNKLHLGIIFDTRKILKIVLHKNGRAKVNSETESQSICCTKNVATKKRQERTPGQANVRNELDERQTNRQTERGIEMDTAKAAAGEIVRAKLKDR